jgi:hypothetical protein
MLLRRSRRRLGDGRRCEPRRTGRRCVITTIPQELGVGVHCGNQIRGVGEIKSVITITITIRSFGAPPSGAIIIEIHRKFILCVGFSIWRNTHRRREFMLVAFALLLFILLIGGRRLLHLFGATVV